MDIAVIQNKTLAPEAKKYYIFKKLSIVTEKELRPQTLQVNVYLTLVRVYLCLHFPVSLRKCFWIQLILTFLVK